MIVVLKQGTPELNVQTITETIRQLGLEPRRLDGTERTVIACIGDERKIDPAAVATLPGVERVMPVLQEYKLASREGAEATTRVRVRDVEVGGDEIIVVAGPCSVEGEKQIIETAQAVKAAGGRMLRGGAFKPRTSPYAFQGMAEEGLKLLAKAREETGLPIVTEVMNTEDVDLVVEYADVLQIGARNVQNYALLRKVGQTRTPVLLKRGMATLLKEFVLAAEYILSEGNANVILCERGIRTFETATRNTLDLNAIPVLQSWSHLPVAADPSHGVGYTKWVPALSKASVAVGADMLLLEIHPEPAKAWSDGGQSMDFPLWAKTMDELRAVAAAVGRRIAPAL
jgi:3-deoxy-7-phosphoheptulonate synthase